jgi:hypothetical protein
MKKLLVLVAVFTTVLVSSANAQGGNFDTAAMRARYFGMKSALIEKTKLTEAQADKVLEIGWQSRSKMRGMRDLSQEERQKKMNDVREETNQQYKAIPLTDEQLKAVNDFFDEQRRLQQQQRQNGGGNGGN